MLSAFALPPLPRAVAALTSDFGAGLTEVLGEEFVSFYLYGSLAFAGPPTWRFDVDYHVLVAVPQSDEVRVRLDALHADLAERHALAAELDGYYITLADARGAEPPTSQRNAADRDVAWALHRAHVRAGRFFLLAGLDPCSVLTAPTWSELDAALQAEMAFIDSHPEEHGYCVLNCCRILYSERTRDVVCSKYDAAQWARTVLPSAQHRVIDAAERRYCQASEPGDAAILEHEAPSFVASIKRALDGL